MSPSEGNLSNGPRTISLSAEERRKGTYDVSSLQNALEGLHQDGLLILQSVVDVEHVDNLNAFMKAESTAVLRKKDPNGDVKAYNQGVKSNILQGPPVTAHDLLYNDVYFNPFVIQIANAYLGSKSLSNFMTGNNALPRTHGLRQSVHKDVRFHHPECPFYVIANIPLCDFNPSNGSTEFWLGSHAHTTSCDQLSATADDAIGMQAAGGPHCFVKLEVVEARHQIRPPVQAECKRGDIMIRDLRLWHAGMPNEIDEDRIMLAIGYQAPWYPNYRQRNKLPLSQCKFFTATNGQPVEMRANFLSDKEAELTRHSENFEFRPSV